MDRLVSQVLFPILSVAHGAVWHTCKFHENAGFCVKLFGLPWDGNHHVPEHPSSKSIFQRYFSSHRSEQDKLNWEILERQQNYRLELVREVNLALAILCALAIFAKSGFVKTQMLVVESIVFGVATWDAIQMDGQGSQLVMPMLLLTLASLQGLVVRLGLVGGSSKTVEGSSAEPTALETVQEARELFEKIPAEVEEVMAKSAEEVAIDTKLFFGDESSVTATVIKPETASSLLGITVKKIPKDWRIVISKLSPTGLLAGSPLKVGQTLMSVNGIPATEFKHATDVTAFIREAKAVTIVATKSIRIHVIKPTMDTKVGVTFAKKDGCPVINKILPDSLFQGTSLEVGMRVLAINNQPCPSVLKEVADVVKETDGSLVMICVQDDDKEVKVPVEKTSKMIATVTKDEGPPESAPPLPKQK